MCSQKQDAEEYGVAPFKRKVILADVNIPYKFTLDRCRNSLFFCINADEFSEQSFHSVVLELHSGSAAIVPSIRNGFASAIDQATGTVYLGGSDGIYKFNYETKDVIKPPLVYGIDIFDMYFQKHLYYVDTANQNLHVYKNNRVTTVSELKDQEIKHFVIDPNGDIMFINTTGFYVLPKGAKRAVLYDNRSINIRGATTDKAGLPHFIAQDGIYAVDNHNQLTKILLLENGYGLAFDKDNNIVYSDERTVNKLSPHDNMFLGCK